MSNRKNNKTTTKRNAVVKAVKAAPVNKAKTYTLVSPKGKVYSVDNLRVFARRFKLDSSALSKVVRGKRAQHKNWRSQG